MSGKGEMSIIISYITSQEMLLFNKMFEIIFFFLIFIFLNFNPINI